MTNSSIYDCIIVEPHNHRPETGRINEARHKELITVKTLSEASKDYEDRLQMKDKIEFKIIEVSPREAINLNL